VKDGDWLRRPKPPGSGISVISRVGAWTALPVPVFHQTPRNGRPQKLAGMGEIAVCLAGLPLQLCLLIGGPSEMGQLRLRRRRRDWKLEGVSFSSYL